jgi:hypothetical protein
MPIKRVIPDNTPFQSSEMAIAAFLLASSLHEFFRESNGSLFIEDGYAR